MRLHITFLLILSISVLTGCTNDSSNDEVLLRLSNTSPFNYANIIIDTSTGNTSFEDINSGEQTVYKTFEKAYRYAYIQLEIDGSTYRIQPIDYVGETPLKAGRYTYAIDADTSNEEYGRLTLSLVEDD